MQEQKEEPQTADYSDELEKAVWEAHEAGALNDEEFSQYQREWDVPFKNRNEAFQRKCSKLITEVRKKHAIYLHMQEKKESVYTHRVCGKDFNSAPFIDFLSFYSPEGTAILLDDILGQFVPIMCEKGFCSDEADRITHVLRGLRNALLKGSNIIDFDK